MQFGEFAQMDSQLRRVLHGKRGPARYAHESDDAEHRKNTAGVADCGVAGLAGRFNAAPCDDLLIPAFAQVLSPQPPVRSNEPNSDNGEGDA